MYAPRPDIQHNQTIIILGMHRSGTSALTGSLQQAGLTLGEVKEYSKDNRKGSRESASVMALHEDIFERNQGAWHSPVANAKWSAVHHQLQDLIIQSHAGESVWGFKDPRTLFFIEQWIEKLPYARLVGIFRHPFFVAESLHKRNQMPYPKALKLWIAYNRRLVQLYHEYKGFPLVEFTADAEKFDKQLTKLIDGLGLNAEKASFFDNSMRQQDLPDLSQVKHADKALWWYKKLQRLATLKPS